MTNHAHKVFNDIETFLRMGMPQDLIAREETDDIEALEGRTCIRAQLMRDENQHELRLGFLDGTLMRLCSYSSEELSAWITRVSGSVNELLMVPVTQAVSHKYVTRSGELTDTHHTVSFTTTRGYLSMGWNSPLSRYPKRDLEIRIWTHNERLSRHHEISLIGLAEAAQKAAAAAA